MTSPRLEATVELEVSPELRQAVATQLQDYLAIQLAIKELEAQADAIKAEVVATFDDAGELAALDAGIRVEGYGAVKMVYVRRHKGRSKASQEEARIKKLSRRQKFLLINTQ